MQKLLVGALAIASLSLHVPANAAVTHQAAPQAAQHSYGATTVDMRDGDWQSVKTANLGSASSDFSGQRFVDAMNELYSSEIPRTVFKSENGAKMVKYMLSDSFSFVGPHPSVLENEGEVRPMLKVGRWDGGWWFEFNQSDQGAVIDGTASTLANLACKIPGVGWLACGFIQTAASKAADWLKKHGTCSGGRNLYAVEDRKGTGFGCSHNPPSR